MNVIYLGRDNWESSPDARRSLSYLARRGHRVLYLEPGPGAASSAGTSRIGTTAIEALRRIFPRSHRAGLREVAAGILVLRPPVARASGSGVPHERRLRALHATRDELRFDAPVFVTERPVSRHTLDALRPVGVVYFPDDHVSATPDQVTPEDAPREIGRREEAFLPHADVVLTRAPWAQLRWSEFHPRTTHVTEHVTDAAKTAATKHQRDAGADAFETCLEEAMREGRKRRPPRPRLYRPARVKGVPSPGLRFRFAFVITRMVGRTWYRMRLFARGMQNRRDLFIRKILIIRRSEPGDVVVLSPALGALHSRYPRARIVLGVQSGADLPTPIEHVDEVCEIDFLAAGSHPLARIARTVALLCRGFDLVLAADRERLMPEGFLSGAPFLIGLDDGHALQAFNLRVLPVDPSRHDAENNLALVDAFVGRRTPRRVPELSPEIPTPPTGVRITLVPGARNPAEQWPVDHYAALAKKLLNAHPRCEIALAGRPADDVLIETIRWSVPGGLRHRVRGRLDQDDHVARRRLVAGSTVVVSSETDTIHLARALGTPLVALFGPGNIRRRGPHPGGPGPAVALRHDVPCSPCRRVTCERLYCMRGLVVDHVAAEVTRLLDHVGRPSSPHEAETSIPLDRCVTRSDWLDLKEQGFDVPRVSVLVLTRPFAPDLRRDPGSSHGGPAGEVDDLVATVEEQDYPNLEIVVVDAGESKHPRSRRPRTSAIALRRVRACGRDPIAAWRLALEAAGGDLIVPLCAGHAWSKTRISTAVAALLSEPDAAATVDHDDGPPTTGEAAYRRAALEAALGKSAHPRSSSLHVRLRTIAPLARPS